MLAPLIRYGVQTWIVWEAGGIPSEEAFGEPTITTVPHPRPQRPPSIGGGGGGWGTFWPTPWCDPEHAPAMMDAKDAYQEFLRTRAALQPIRMGRRSRHRYQVKRPAPLANAPTAHVAHKKFPVGRLWRMVAGSSLGSKLATGLAGFFGSKLVTLAVANRMAPQSVHAARVATSVGVFALSWVVTPKTWKHRGSLLAGTAVAAVHEIIAAKS